MLVLRQVPTLLARLQRDVVVKRPRQKQGKGKPNNAEHYYLRDEQVEARDASIDEVGALMTEGCDNKGPRRGKEQRVRRWQRPREETTPVKTREEGARARGRVRGRTAIRPEETKQRIVVPPEVPHDTRICVEDLVDIDESDVDQLRVYEKIVKQPGAGTQEPVKRETAKDRDPRTLERKEQCRLETNKASLSSQCWARCIQPRTAHFPRRREREMKSELSEAEQAKSKAAAMTAVASNEKALKCQSSDHIAKSDVAKDTMSVTVKLAKEIDEPDINQPTAECHLMAWPHERRRVGQRCDLQPAQGGAEDTNKTCLGVAHGDVREE